MRSHTRFTRALSHLVMTDREFQLSDAGVARWNGSCEILSRTCGHASAMCDHDHRMPGAQTLDAAKSECSAHVAENGHDDARHDGRPDRHVLHDGHGRLGRLFPEQRQGPPPPVTVLVTLIGSQCRPSHSPCELRNCPYNDRMSCSKCDCGPDKGKSSRWLLTLIVLTAAVVVAIVSR